MYDVVYCHASYHSTGARISDTVTCCPVRIFIVNLEPIGSPQQSTPRDFVGPSPIKWSLTCRLLIYRGPDWGCPPQNTTSGLIAGTQQVGFAEHSDPCHRATLT